MNALKKAEVIKHLAHYQNKLAKASGKKAKQYYRGVVEGLEIMAGVDHFANLSAADRRLFDKLDFLLSRFSPDLPGIIPGKTSKATIEKPDRVWVCWDADGVAYVLKGKTWYRIAEKDLQFTGKVFGKYGEDVALYAIDGLLGLKLLTKREERRLLQLFYAFEDAEADTREAEKILAAVKLLEESGYTVEKQP
jgi:hypothetical protein